MTSRSWSVVRQLLNAARMAAGGPADFRTAPGSSEMTDRMKTSSGCLHGTVRALDRATVAPVGGMRGKRTQHHDRGVVIRHVLVAQDAADVALGGLAGEEVLRRGLQRRVAAIEAKHLHQHAQAAISVGTGSRRARIALWMRMNSSPVRLKAQPPSSSLPSWRMAIFSRIRTEAAFSAAAAASTRVYANSQRDGGHGR